MFLSPRNCSILHCWQIHVITKLLVILALFSESYPKGLLYTQCMNIKSEKKKKSKDGRQVFRDRTMILWCHSSIPETKTNTLLSSVACFSKLAFAFQNTYRQVHAHTHPGIDENQPPAGIELWLYLHKREQTHTARVEHFILWMLHKHKYWPPTLSPLPGDHF